MLEAAKTGPVTLEVASCARPAPLLNHRPLPPQKPSSSRRGERSPSRGRIGKAETAWAQIEAATWPVYARAQLQGVMRARCPCPGAGGRRRCRTHIYSGSPYCSSGDCRRPASPAGTGCRLLKAKRGSHAVCFLLRKKGGKEGRRRGDFRPYVAHLCSSSKLGCRGAERPSAARSAAQYGIA